MRFAILDPKAVGVKDPVTGEVLGSIFKPKVSVEVTRVEPRLSLAATYRKSRVNIGGSGTGLTTLGRLFDPPQYVDQYETFKSSDQSWEELPEAESYVKVGDPVVQVSQRQAELQVETSAATGSAAAQVTRTSADDTSSGADKARAKPAATRPKKQ